MKFVSNGEVQFPLYHQTSSIFIESINKHGFCGVNFIKESGVLESLIKLVSYAKSQTIEIPFYISNMANQSCNNKFNYRHGGGYVTPSKNSAVRYATSNKFGSELVSNVLNFADSLEKNGSEINNFLTDDLIKILNSNPFPVLIEIIATPINALQGEKQEGFEVVMNEIAKLGHEPGERMFELRTQQKNFEVISVLPREKLNFYKINFEKPVDPICPRYSLTEI